MSAAVAKNEIYILHVESYNENFISLWVMAADTYFLIEKPLRIWYLTEIAHFISSHLPYECFMRWLSGVFLSKQKLYFHFCDIIKKSLLNRLKYD